MRDAARPRRRGSGALALRADHARARSPSPDRRARDRAASRCRSCSSVAENQARQQLKAQATALVAGRATGSHVASATAGRIGRPVRGRRPDGSVTGRRARSVATGSSRQLQARASGVGTTTLGGKDAVLVGHPDRGRRRHRRRAQGRRHRRARNADLRRWHPASRSSIGLAVGDGRGRSAGAAAREAAAPPGRQRARARRRPAWGRHRGRVGSPRSRTSRGRSAGWIGAVHVSEDRQREFLLSVSHEIRTPLTAIRGYAEALADGVDRSGGRRRGSAAILPAEAERLGRFLGDLLELARLEADDFAIDPQQLECARDGRASGLGLERCRVARRGRPPCRASRTARPRHDRRDAAAPGGGRAHRERPAGDPGRRAVVVAAPAADRIRSQVRDGGPGLSRGGRGGRLRARRPPRALPGRPVGRNGARALHRAAVWSGVSAGGSRSDRPRRAGRRSPSPYRPLTFPRRSADIPPATLVSMRHEQHP